MARPAPRIDRRDRFRVVEEENTPDDLSPAQPVEDDGGALDARTHPPDWPGDIARADPTAATQDDALTPDAAEFADIQPEPMVESAPSLEKQRGEMSTLSLALMALVAAGLSAAVVLYLF